MTPHSCIIVFGAIVPFSWAPYLWTNPPGMLHRVSWALFIWMRPPSPRYLTQSQLTTLYMDESPPPPRYVTQSQLSTLYMNESPQVCYKDIDIQHRHHWTQTQCIHQVVLFLFAYLLIFSIHVMAGYIHISAQVLRHNVDVLIFAGTYFHGRQTPNQCVGKHNSA